MTTTPTLHAQIMNLPDGRSFSTTQGEQLAYKRGDKYARHAAAELALAADAEIKRLTNIESDWMALSQDDGKAQREIERLTAEIAAIHEAWIKYQDNRKSIRSEIIKALEDMEHEIERLTDLVEEQRLTIAALMFGAGDDGTTPVIRRLAAVEFERDTLRAELAALKAQVPVAWRDPTNMNPGQSVTFDRTKREKWPHIYSRPLFAAPVPAADAELTDEQIDTLIARHVDPFATYRRLVAFARAVLAASKGTP